MAQLGARKVSRIGNTFAEYITEWPPRLVLDRLSLLGFRVVCEFFGCFFEFHLKTAMTGAGQTVIWTMVRDRKPDPLKNGLNRIEENGNGHPMSDNGN